MKSSNQDNSITDIIFDLGKVIVSFDWNIALGKIAQHAPREISDLIIQDRAGFMQLLAEPAGRLERGLISFAQFYSIISNTLSLDVSIEELRQIWCDIFWANPDVISIGNSLALRYNVHLMSNTSEVHYQWIIARFPEVVFYQKAALSYELGCMKPEAEYYTRAFELFNSSPANALFIDDLQENLDGAEVLGIRTIRFENLEKLKNRLIEYGVKF